MVSDQEIAKAVEVLLTQSDPKSFKSFGDIVHQLEAKLGFDLSQKTVIVRDQINNLFRPHLVPQPQPPPPAVAVAVATPIPVQPKDHFALHHHQFPQYVTGATPQHLPQFHHPHFALQQHHHQQQLQLQLQQQQQQQQQQQHQQQQQQHRHHPVELNFSNPSPPPQPPSQAQPQVHAQPHVQPQEGKVELNAKSVGPKTSEKPKKSAAAGTKRRGGPGGLNKLCGISPELQAIVGQPRLGRTEIVKQLWAYIKRNNLQDPSNKRKIVCDDALRVVFETDSTDMFKMNKLLAKHIIRLEPTKETSRSKRLKEKIEPASEDIEPGLCPVVISEALSNFLGTEATEMPQAEILRLVWEYVKANNLEDPRNPMVIMCDAKLKEILGCESINTLEIPDLLAQNHLLKR